MTVFIYANMYGIFVINLPSLKQEIEVSQPKKSWSHNG